MSRETRILGNLSTAVLGCNGRRQIAFINAAGESLLGVSAKKTLGQPLRDFVGNAEVDVAAKRALASGERVTLWEMELRTSARTTAVTVDCTLTPVMGRGARDRLIVELAGVDRLVRRPREGGPANRHSLSQAMLSGLAHEIRNPLGGLRGAAQLLDRELSDRELREYTRIIIHEADRLRNLVDRMMSPTRPLIRERVNVHEVLEHVFRLLATEASAAGIGMERDYDPSLPPVVGEREQLIQAVLNVARNALEAMPDGGGVCFRTRIERQATIAGVRHRHVLRVDIEDNGPGIPEALREQIFYPMVTGRPEGTGLGLSIAHDIIGGHGGGIECDSRPGRTCFSLLLPAAEDRP